MKNLILLLVISLFTACTDSNIINIPDTILSKEKMAEVLVDVHMQESSMNITGVSTNKIELALSDISLNLDVLKKNKITKKQFDESFNFYTSHPKLLSEVYQLVLTNLSKMQAEVNKK